MASWHHEAISRDYQTIKIRYFRGSEKRAITIHNIYNQNGTNTLQLLRDQLAMAKGNQEDHVVVGDINLHHPIWGGPNVTGDDIAEDFIHDMDEADMELMTEPGIATWQREDQESTIDLTYVSRSLTERLIECTIADDLENSSDHLPIRTTIDITTVSAEQPKRRNFKLTDNGKLLDFVRANLQAFPTAFTSAHQIEQATDHLIEIINQGIAISTPWADPSNFSNPDFTPECRETVKEARRLRRAYKLTKNPQDWHRYTEARNRKKRIVARALKAGHRKRVEEVTKDPRGLWKLNKWARNRSNFDQGCTPELTVKNQSNQDIKIILPEEKAVFSRGFSFRSRLTQT
jgi:hypothetical protein